MATVTEANFSNEEIEVINSMSRLDQLAIVCDKNYKTDCLFLGYDLFERFPYHPNLNSSSRSSAITPRSSVDKKHKFQDSTTELGSCSAPKPKKPRVVVRLQAPAPPRELSVEYKDRIAELGGYKTRLVIQKKLYMSDLAKDQARLTMSFKQCKVDLGEYLGDNAKCTVTVIFMEDGKWNTMRMSLGKWDKLSSYVFIGSWNDLVVAYRLKKDDVLQVWCFRHGDRLSFALVKLK